MVQIDGPANRMDLAEVARQFSLWRAERKRGERIPSRLWKAVISLSERHSLEEISSTLPLDYRRLEKRVGAEQSRKNKRSGNGAIGDARFVEVGPLSGGCADECTVEAEDSAGRKLTMHLKGAGCAHAVEIAKALWNVGR